MLEIKKNFKDAIVGLSDHTEDIYTSLGAVALGASVIEKHFTDNKKSKGPDMSSSLDPNDLKKLIIGSKTIFIAKKGKKKPLLQEKKTISFAFASVAATQDISKAKYLLKIIFFQFDQAQDILNQKTTRL